MKGFILLAVASFSFLFGYLAGEANASTSTDWRSHVEPEVLAMLDGATAPLPAPLVVIPVAGVPKPSTPISTPPPPHVHPEPSEGPLAASQGVSSTAYCLTGTMASGKRVYSGAVAMNGPKFGTRYRVLSGSASGRTFTVEDRIGHGSGFDIAMPGDCGAARRYGRQRIQIQRIG